ncbi:hypothetical protein, partial [Stenotrophomonas sp.]|uniref:hypothetical protein n=1 Tax=Stenotrophomonas sp. TaxID=69392 RepID=UPI0028A8B13A
YRASRLPSMARHYPAPARFTRFTCSADSCSAEALPGKPLAEHGSALPQAGTLSSISVIFRRIPSLSASSARWRWPLILLPFLDFFHDVIRL